MLLNKKGLSSIVATVLILLLTFFSVSLLASFIIPFVKDNLAKSTECTNLDKIFQFDESFDLNCRKVSGGEYNLSFSINRNDDDNKKINGFLIIFYGNESSKSLEVIDGMNKTAQFNMLNYSEQKIEIPSLGESRSYTYHSGKVYTKAEIKSILKSGRVCELVSDNIKITVCP